MHLKSHPNPTNVSLASSRDSQHIKMKTEFGVSCPYC